ncbi:phage tail protein [Betaproteobacteria bacterium GR16-43]|nr:phage tail protein [Betaproteobacteria bacterium GR16-43]
MADPFLGEVRMFAGTFAPIGWELCNGQLLPIAENDALYNLLGTTYGGDGVNTFGVPDLRGRSPVHQGQGQGLSNRVLGQLVGIETVQLTASQIPAHYHPLHAISTAGTLSIPTNATFAGASTEEKQYTQNAPNVTMAATCTAPTGGGQPHENMAPFLAVTFIIATQGIYPSQG